MIQLLCVQLTKFTKKEINYIKIIKIFEYLTDKKKFTTLKYQCK